MNDSRTRLLVGARVGAVGARETGALVGVGWRVAVVGFIVGVVDSCSTLSSCEFNEFPVLASNVVLFN